MPWKKGLADVKREEREAQGAIHARDDALGVWNAHYQGVADVVTGLFDLVGNGELAAKVRPSSRKRAGRSSDEDSETPTTPSNASEESSNPNE